MIHRILVALDGSFRAPTVLDAAAEVALRFGAELQPFRAIFVPPEFPAAAAGSVADPLPERLSRQARDELAQLLQRPSLGNVTRAAPLVRFGIPWRLIVDVSEEIDADLIVIGSHGYHGLDFVMGTTAARVADLARRDVLVVHDRSGQLSNADAVHSPYRRGGP